jgi:predicted permease
MTVLLQDIRYAFRQLQRSAGFTAVAVLTLALGIGANTALFSVVNGVLLNPLPFPHAEQLVAIGESKTNFLNGSISYPNFRDWQKENHSFSAIAMSRIFSFNLIGSGEPEQIDGELVSSNLFSVLGVQPLMGRNFVAGEDEIGAAQVALMGEGLWRRKFGASLDILGKSITLGPKNYTIVGIVPASFHLTMPSFVGGELYLPLGQWNNPLLNNRAAGLGFHGVGRLNPGVTLEQARADMDRVSRNLALAYPDTNQGIGANLVPLKQGMVGRVKPLLLVLLAAVGFVLLIACVNVANLMLARSAARNREFAIRTALGASQGHVIRQLLTESVLLALISGVCGILLAALGTKAALGVLPSALPRAQEIGLDARVLGFSLLISLFSGVLFGLTPALKMSRVGVSDTLKESGRSGSGVRNRTQSIFVIAEMSMAIVLLVGAGLMLRSLTQLWRVDLGFNPQNTIAFGLTLPPSTINANPDAIRAYFREFNGKLAAIPGVQAVSQTSGAMPLDFDDEKMFWIEGQTRPANDNEMSQAINYNVEEDYLKVMRTPLRKGRFFTRQDNEHSPKVVVVDEVFAGKYFPGQEVLGKRIHLKGSSQSAEIAEIVGVVAHVKQWGIDTDDTEALRAQLYIPSMQMPDEFIKMAASVVFVVRAIGQPSALFAAIHKVSQQMSTQQVIYGEETMNEVVTRSLATPRFVMILLGTFAGLAMVLASVGIYGVISYVVGRRTHEIGIRMALGAQRADILRLILGQGTQLVSIGIAIGIAGAMGLTRLMASQLFQVSATDPLTFAAVAQTLALVALAACYIPAHRAAKVDPMVALRYE